MLSFHNVNGGRVLPVFVFFFLLFQRGGVDGLVTGGRGGVGKIGARYCGGAWRGSEANLRRKPPVLLLQRLRGGGGKYYRVLGLPEGCDDEEEIKKAYKKAAMRWHPDRVKEPLKKEAESKFKEIGEAYETLSDPDRKAFYDRYGDQGVSSARERGDPSEGRSAYAGRAAPDAGFDFAFNDPFEVFQNLFGGAMGGGGMGGMHGMGMHGMGMHGSSGADMFGRTVFHTPGGVHVVMGQPSVLGIGIELLSKVAQDWMASRAEQRDQPRTVEVPLHCSLEELLEGCSKQLKGPAGCGDDEFIVEVQPGWKDGTRVSFLSEGQGGEPINVIFVVKEDPHPLLRREGHDLRWTCACTAAEAAEGLKVTVPVLGKGSKRRLALKPGWIKDGREHRIHGQGMPIRGGPERGDLICEFAITSRTTRALSRLGATCWASLVVLARRLRDALLVYLFGIGSWLQAAVFEPLARTEQWAWIRERTLRVLPHLVTFVILLFVNPMYAYIQAAALLAQMLGIFDVQQGSGGRRRRR